MPEQSHRSVHEGDQHGIEERSSPAGTAGREEDPEDPAGDQSGNVTLRGLAGLERLKDHIEAAAMELRRLREENRALAERIQELEARPEIEPGETVLALDRDPELLKRKIAGFIEAVDACLDRERTNS